MLGSESACCFFWHTNNPHTLTSKWTGTEEEEDGVKSKKTFRSQSVVTQNPEAELMLEGDDDAVSLLQEKEIDNLAGKTHTHKYTHTQCYSTSEQ